MVDHTRCCIFKFTQKNKTHETRMGLVDASNNLKHLQTRKSLLVLWLARLHLDYLDCCSEAIKGSTSNSSWVNVHGSLAFQAGATPKMRKAILKRAAPRSMAHRLPKDVQYFHPAPGAYENSSFVDSDMSCDAYWTKQGWEIFQSQCTSRVIANFPCISYLFLLIWPIPQPSHQLL